MNGWLLLTGAILAIPEREIISFKFQSGFRIAINQHLFAAIFIIAGLVFT